MYHLWQTGIWNVRIILDWLKFHLKTESIFSHKYEVILKAWSSPGFDFRTPEIQLLSTLLEAKSSTFFTFIMATLKRGLEWQKNFFTS